MNIQNVTISGPEAGFVVSTTANNVVYGIWFNDAGGSVSNVIVEHIWQQPNPKPLQPDRPGHPGRRRDGGAHRRYHQHGGKGLPEERVRATLVGRSDDDEPVGQYRGTTPCLAGLHCAERGVVCGCGGHDRRKRDHRCAAISTDAPDGGANGTAILLSGANNVTVDQNIITGLNTDIGVSVSANSNNITISFNEIGRTVEDDYRRPRRYWDRRRPSDLERNADLQHLQFLESKHQWRGTDLLHGAARRHRV